MKRILPLLLLAPSAAMAHPGHFAGLPLVAGLSHPLAGADHLLAMLAVGLCAAMAGGRALWALPLAFVGGLVAGGALGMAGVALPGVEPMIAASVMALGLAAALALRPGLALALPVVAAFGLFHGQAHGAEAPEAGLALYALGFAATSAALHGAGLVLGLRLRPALVRGLGAATALAGLTLAMAG